MNQLSLFDDSMPETMLDSVSEEFVCEEKPWADTDELIRRLRELQEEEDDNDGA